MPAGLHNADTHAGCRVFQRNTAEFRLLSLRPAGAARAFYRGDDRRQRARDVLRGLPGGRADHRRSRPDFVLPPAQRVADA